MRLYLVGFMAVGKTTVGQELAERLHVPFYDLDALIEAAEGRTIKEIFATEGEAFFRQREREVLRSTRFLDNAVIATGGGTFTFNENMLFIRAGGLSVHLAPSFQTLKQRLEGKATDRPLFKDEASTYELYQYRLKYYKMADITLEIRADETTTEVVERIRMQLPRGAFVQS
jgi:shikimate kinase